MAPSLRLSDWTRLYRPGKGEPARPYFRRFEDDWTSAGNDPIVALRELVTHPAPWQLAWYGDGDELVVIADAETAETVDYWRTLLRLAGEIPA